MKNTLIENVPLTYKTFLNAVDYISKPGNKSYFKLSSIQTDQEVDSLDDVLFYVSFETMNGENNKYFKKLDGLLEIISSGLKLIHVPLFASNQRPKFEGDVLNASLEDLGFSFRVKRILNNAGIETIDNLLKISDLELLQFHGFGRLSLEEVNSILAEYSLKLKEYQYN